MFSLILLLTFEINLNLGIIYIFSVISILIFLSINKPSGIYGYMEKIIIFLIYLIMLIVSLLFLIFGIKLNFIIIIGSIIIGIELILIVILERAKQYITGE